MGYVDLYLLPVPLERLDEYQDQATEFGQVLIEYGGLNYREFKIEDPGEATSEASFLFHAPVKEGYILTSAVAEFTSRQHRDDVMAKVMADERIKAMEDLELGDMTGMVYGGFEQFVDGKEPIADNTADDTADSIEDEKDATSDAATDKDAL